MAELEYEVDVPNPGNELSHSEAEWREGDDVVHTKKFADHYESFWYTDANQKDFASEVQNYYNSTYDKAADDQFFCRAVKDDSETVVGDDIRSLTDQSEVSDLVYLEAGFDGINTYWEEEAPLRDDFPDFKNIIHVSGPLSAVETFEHLFDQLAPDRLNENKRQGLMSDPVEYLEDTSE